MKKEDKVKLENLIKALVDEKDKSTLEVKVLQAKIDGLTEEISALKNILNEDFDNNLGD